MKAKLVHLTDRQFDRLGETADEIGISMSELIRRILDEHIEAGRPAPKGSDDGRIPRKMKVVE